MLYGLRKKLRFMSAIEAGRGSYSKLSYCIDERRSVKILIGGA